MSVLSPEHAAHLADVRRDATALAESLTAAEAAGMSQAVLLPELITIMRETGLLPSGFKLPGFLLR